MNMNSTFGLSHRLVQENDEGITVLEDDNPEGDPTIDGCVHEDRCFNNPRFNTNAAGAHAGEESSSKPLLSKIGYYGGPPAHSQRFQLKDKGVCKLKAKQNVLWRPDELLTSNIMMGGGLVHKEVEIEDLGHSSLPTMEKDKTASEIYEKLADELETEEETDTETDSEANSDDETNCEDSSDMADNSAGAGSPKVGQPPAYAPSVNPWYDRYTCHVDMPMGPPPKTPQYSSRGKVLDSSHGISKG